MPISMSSIISRQPDRLNRAKYIGKGEIKECKICMQDYVVGEMLIYLGCMHSFHEKCLMKWIKAKREQPQCPICKTDISDS